MAALAETRDLQGRRTILYPMQKQSVICRHADKRVWFHEPVHMHAPDAKADGNIPTPYTERKEQMGSGIPRILVLGHRVATPRALVALREKGVDVGGHWVLGVRPSCPPTVFIVAVLDVLEAGPRYLSSRRWFQIGNTLGTVVCPLREIVFDERILLLVVLCSEL
jgi:hypothetical protein